MPDQLVFIVVPVFIWAACRVLLPNTTFELDFDVTHATFMLLYDRLYNIAWLMFVGGIALALYGKHEFVPKVASESCLAGALFALAFVVYLLLSYQKYLHARYPRNGAPGISPYTVNRYALTNTLGFSALIFFVMGVVLTVTGIQ